MGRSFTGGTRGFLRGKVAQDMFQVTKTAGGRKVQLVSQYAATRRNPNTISQAIARMNMAACMGCLSQFKEIVDHSWEGIPYGQLSIAHFVEVNIPLLQQDQKEFWDGGSHFDYPVKGVSEIRMGEWILSTGTLKLPACVSESAANTFEGARSLVISIGKRNATYDDLVSALGANAGDFMTQIVFAYSFGTGYKKFAYRRYYLEPSLLPGLIITSENVYSLFRTEGSADFEISYRQDIGEIRFTIHVRNGNALIPQNLSAVIFSKWNGQVWMRNSSQFAPAPNQIDPYGDYMAPGDVFDSWFPDWDGVNPFGV